MRPDARLELSSRSVNGAMPQRILLCRILDIDLGVGFADLTIRCVAHADGSATSVDLMFVAIDVQILRAAIVDAPVTTDNVRKSSDGTRAVSLHRRGRSFGEPG